MSEENQTPEENQAAAEIAAPEKETSENKMRWYVVQAYSQYESRVKKTLLEYIKMHEMEKFFGQVLVPTEEVVEMRAGQKRKSERKFYPGYVLVEMEMNEQS